MRATTCPPRFGGLDIYRLRLHDNHRLWLYIIYRLRLYDDHRLRLYIIYRLRLYDFRARITKITVTVRRLTTFMPAMR
ncbi:MAG: hypothetical protein FWG71_01335 [Synergistaceae bacterium]|nr:hypothetical protein [Synergistaceae bacterium]